MLSHRFFAGSFSLLNDNNVNTCENEKHFDFSGSSTSLHRCEPNGQRQFLHWNTKSEFFSAKRFNMGDLLWIHTSTQLLAFFPDPDHGLYVTLSA